jgi:hypothetical protein
MNAQLVLYAVHQVAHKSGSLVVQPPAKALDAFPQAPHDLFADF